MTIKKSDLQALLDTLPDEFEPELFDAGYALLTEEEPVPEWQIDAAAEAARDVRENGGHTMEEFKARAEAWIQEKA